MEMLALPLQLAIRAYNYRQQLELGLMVNGNRKVSQKLH
jgi:hypothetical protein